MGGSGMCCSHDRAACIQYMPGKRFYAWRQSNLAKFYLRVILNRMNTWMKALDAICMVLLTWVLLYSCCMTQLITTVTFKVWPSQHLYTCVRMQTNMSTFSQQTMQTIQELIKERSFAETRDWRIQEDKKSSSKKKAHKRGRKVSNLEDTRPARKKR